jgi:hypothetical protein
VYLTCGSVNKLKDLASFCMSKTTSFKRDKDKASMSISFLILHKETNYKWQYKHAIIVAAGNISSYSEHIRKELHRPYNVVDTQTM